MKNRLPEIDFIKGVAIVSVLLLHTLPNNILDFIYDSIHIGQAVPLFLFTTIFLSFKGLARNEKGSLLSYYYSSKRMKRVLKDIVLPFFIVVAFELLLRVFVEGKPLSKYDFWGFGPGNYYFWVYVQLWILLPFLYIVMKTSIVGGGIFLLAVSIFLNVLFVRINISPELYRLSCIRYIFLAVPAYCLLDCELKHKTRFPVGIIVLLITSFVYLVYLKTLDLSPVVLNFGWAGEQWPAYFWTYFVFCCLLLLGRRLSGFKLSLIFERFGRNSWYIFLSQMFLLNYLGMDCMSFIGNGVLRVLVFIFTIFVLSIIPARIIDRVKKES